MANPAGSTTALLETRATLTVKPKIPIESVDIETIKRNHELGIYISSSVRNRNEEQAVGLLKTAVIELQNQDIEIDDNALTNKENHIEALVEIFRKLLVLDSRRIREILDFCSKKKGIFLKVKPLSINEAKIPEIGSPTTATVFRNGRRTLTS